MSDWAESPERRQFVSVGIAGELYGIDVCQVREIVPVASLTAVPHAPRALRGVMNLRGSVVPVVDLAVQFGVGATSLGPRTCVVVVSVDSEAERQPVGVLADAVHQVLDSDPADLLPPPSFGAAVSMDLLVGLMSVGGKFLLVIDLARALGACAGLAPAVKA